ncbi:MAG: ATP-binding protein, partial [Muribaculaceae bacterium]|nr:ATP-binding protein [Muribaculaceae bacterium]
MSYQDTSLWKRTLGLNDKNVEPLRESYLRARENAEYLLGKIRQDFPNLTVHDITHVDSLWNVANTIIGENYPINPLEGYILGIAFLIHDAALSYDSVGGIDKLRDTIEWKDAYADGSGEKDEEEFKKECDFAAIRALHAKYAENIPTQTYKRDNGTTFFIIENDDYRTYFGNRIGKIAASHHWTIDDVVSRFVSQITPIYGVPSEWDINEQKLACILRCADAGHIDNGRAPYSIYRSLSINGVSRNHWESQIRLGQVRPNKNEPDKLLITSTMEFKKGDFAAWNVAYEAVKLFDDELKKCNDLLKSIDKDIVFPYVGVSGASSKEELANYIKTEGWQPCNFGVHTSNIKYLIENLGGSKLYGEDNMLLVALRELIQNARDAILARQKMDSFNDGRITVRLIEEDNNRFIEVEDNGIGMSLDCIKYNFLNFGSSYWKSSLLKYEYPGLKSKGFESIGKYGIGFYSVFMVAKSVEVQTRRYDKGAEEANRIEFPQGLTLSPIISKCSIKSEKSTIVRFQMKDKVSLNFHISNMIKTSNHNVQMSKFISLIVAGLDCNVYYQGECIHENINLPNFNRSQWLKGMCIKRSADYDEYAVRIAESLEIIRDEKGNIRGLFTMCDDKSKLMPSIMTVGGLLAYQNNTISSLNDLTNAIKSSLYNSGYGFIGYLDCRENSISRDRVYIDELLKGPLQNWFIQKYINNYESIINSEDLANSYCLFLRLFGSDDKVIKELIKHNEKELFDKHFSELSNTDLKSALQGIHRYLFLGLLSDLNRFSSSDDIIDKQLLQIDHMPENEYNEIIN